MANGKSFARKIRKSSASYMKNVGGGVVQPAQAAGRVMKKSGKFLKKNPQYVDIAGKMAVPAAAGLAGAGVTAATGNPMLGGVAAGMAAQGTKGAVDSAQHTKKIRRAKKKQAQLQKAQLAAAQAQRDFYSKPRISRPVPE